MLKLGYTMVSLGIIILANVVSSFEEQTTGINDAALLQINSRETNIVLDSLSDVEEYLYEFLDDSLSIESSEIPRNLSIGVDFNSTTQRVNVLVYIENADGNMTYNITADYDVIEQLLMTSGYYSNLDDLEDDFIIFNSTEGCIELLSELSIIYLEEFSAFNDLLGSIGIPEGDFYNIFAVIDYEVFFTITCGNRTFDQSYYYENPISLVNSISFLEMGLDLNLNDQVSSPEYSSESEECMDSVALEVTCIDGDCSANHFYDTDGYFNLTVRIDHAQDGRNN